MTSGYVQKANLLHKNHYMNVSYLYNPQASCV